MKQYLVIDKMGEYKELMDYEGLKLLLVEKVMQDLKLIVGKEEFKKESLKDAEILEKLIFENDISYIAEKLKLYCLKTIDLQQIIRDLQDIEMAYRDKPYPDGNFGAVIETIEDKINKKESE